MQEFNEKAASDDELYSLGGSEDEGPHERHTYFNKDTGFKDPQLCKGMKFTSAYVFRKALREWAIKRGYTYVFNKNCTTRVSAICENKCGCRIHASKLRDCSTFQIKTFKPNH